MQYTLAGSLGAGGLQPGDLLQRPFHLFGGEGGNQEIAGALAQAAQHQFRIVARRAHDDGQLGVGAAIRE
jgi:hypothetical protein